MKIGCTAASFSRFGEERYKKMKEHGFDYADISIDGELKGGSEQEYAAKLHREKELADAAGVTLWQAHGPWRWPVRDYTEEDRRERFETMQRSIRACASIGVKYWVIHPIMPFGADKDPEPEKLWQMNLDFFRALLPTAKENGVMICYENMPMKALSNSTPEAMIRFIDEIDDDNFKFCLDTGHCAVFGISPAEAARLAGGRLHVLHVHDNSGRMDEHRLPYFGIIDWADFYKGLCDIGFDGVFSLECGFPSGLSDTACELLIRSVRQSLDDLMK